MFIVCAVQLNVICQCCNPLGGTENGISATPTVDGGRGDPIPDQGYIKKKKLNGNAVDPSDFLDYLPAKSQGFL